MYYIKLLSVGVILCLSLLFSGPGFCDDVSVIGQDKESIEKAFRKPAYSPYAGQNYPTKVLWGDTHVHTALSLDARAFGVTLDPEMAYRFARGEEVTASHGERLKLSRPLDWLVVADHSDAMGAMKEIINGDPNLLRDPTVKDWHDRIAKGGETALMATMDIIQQFTAGNVPEVLVDETFIKNIWDDYLKTAEEYNDPGKFTTVIGYEWTSTPGGNNLHRNVLYRGDSDEAKQMLPYTAADSMNPEDLWKWMEAFEDKTGGQVLALAHNGNLSNGLMFPEINPVTKKPISKNPDPEGQALVTPIRG